MQGTLYSEMALHASTQESGCNTSFGKGEIQTLMPLGDGSGLAVTVARYLTPNGHPIQGVGLQPDQELEGSGPNGSLIGSDEDPWLRAAAAALERQVEA